MAPAIYLSQGLGLSSEVHFELLLKKPKVHNAASHFSRIASLKKQSNLALNAI